MQTNFKEDGGKDGGKKPAPISGGGGGRPPAVLPPPAKPPEINASSSSSSPALTDQLRGFKPGMAAHVAAHRGPAVPTVGGKPAKPPAAPKAPKAPKPTKQQPPAVKLPMPDADMDGMGMGMGMGAGMGMGSTSNILMPGGLGGFGSGGGHGAWKEEVCGWPSNAPPSHPPAPPTPAHTRPCPLLTPRVSDPPLAQSLSDMLMDLDAPLEEVGDWPSKSPPHCHPPALRC